MPALRPVASEVHVHHTKPFAENGDQVEKIPLCALCRERIRHATGIYVLTLAGHRICAMTRFEASAVPWFGLPRSLPSR